MYHLKLKLQYYNFSPDFDHSKNRFIDVCKVVDWKFFVSAEPIEVLDL